EVRVILSTSGRRLNTALNRQESGQSPNISTHKMSRRARQTRGLGHFTIALTAVLSWSVGSFSLASAASTPSTSLGWQTTWTSPTDMAAGLANNSTVRDIATVAVAGNEVQLTFSNLWNPIAKKFADVTIGVN